MAQRGRIQDRLARVTADMVGNPGAKVAAKYRAETGDLYAAALIGRGWPTPESA